MACVEKDNRSLALEDKLDLALEKHVQERQSKYVLDLAPKEKLDLAPKKQLQETQSTDVIRLEEKLDTIIINQSKLEKWIQQIISNQEIIAVNQDIINNKIIRL